MSTVSLAVPMVNLSNKMDINAVVTMYNIVVLYRITTTTYCGSAF